MTLLHDDSTSVLTTTDPRDGSPIASYSVASADDVRRTVDRAREAGTWWAGLSFSERRTR